MDLFSFFKSSNKSTKDIAKDRLKLVLIHDRGDFSQEKKEAIKKELVEVLSKYMEVDSGSVEISIVDQRNSNDNQSKPQLRANVPINKIFHN